jgi:hypothetical protein
MTNKNIQIEGASPVAKGQQQRGGYWEGSSNEPVMQVYVFKERDTFWVMVHGIGHAKKKS